MGVVNTDTTSYQYKPPISAWKPLRRQRKKYIDDCLEQCWHFTPFVVSVGGILGVKAEATLKLISRHLTTKWKEP